MHLQARCWYEQRRLEESKSEALHAADIFEKLMDAKDLEVCGGLLRPIEEALDDGEFL